MCWRYLHDERYRAVYDGTAVPPKKIVANQPIPKTTPRSDCRHLGNILEYCHKCNAELKHVRECDLHGKCTFGDFPNRNKEFPCCATCSDYSSELLTINVPPVSSMKVGVAIGCYGWPKLVDVHIHLIRYHCGNVPILVCDDASPHGKTLEAIAAKHDDVSFWPNENRGGHYRGDVSVFCKGVQWGNNAGLDYVCKVSQRMLVDVPDWLQLAADELRVSGRSTLAQRCIDNRVDLLIRSELVMMRLDQWNKPDVIEQLELKDRPELKDAAELHINHVVEKHLGGKHPWPGLTVDRYQTTPGYVWHCSHKKEDYQNIAHRFSLPLDDDFTTSGWQWLPTYKRG